MKSRMLIAAGALVVFAATAAVAADPFEDARYYMGIKKNDEALRLINSGQLDINMQNDEGYTLLHYAADNGNLDMVKALLQLGADPTLKSKTGSTAYDMATNSTIKLLLAKAQQAVKAGATATSDAAPAPKSTSAPGAPWSAASSGNGMCAAVLADPANNGRSAALRPLMKARDDIWYNHPDELAALLDDCVNANAKDPTGSTLLHTAADRDRVDAARILLAHGASRSVTDAAGNTPAAYAKSPEMKALLGSVTASAKAKSSPSTPASADRRKECSQKWYADQALASGDMEKARAYRKWQQCLKTGLYHQ